ncbi:hypothetical protein M422DRAFT_56226 [Sphaerobolus stellatus SS14]|uniref:Uncharacterized protein n=1 Tax=Sphaerobolus stellatus (strain SS14) TaxID=990650 RepID=A0A0C9U715_SPHS4|nr:hypothetical protein M422DRAFT_56226 [Sphaerobolus stellatus SS14]
MRLVMYPFGFEDAWKRRKRSGAELGDIVFFAKCLQSATAVVKQLCDVHAPSGYLKYAPDCYFVMGGFCAAFMLKMLRLEFSSLLEPTQRERIISLVQRFVEMLASPVASIDETHTPMLYAKFLHGQVKHVLAAEKEAQGRRRRSSLLNNGNSRKRNTNTNPNPTIRAKFPKSKNQNKFKMTTSATQTHVRLPVSPPTRPHPPVNHTTPQTTPPLEPGRSSTARPHPVGLCGVPVFFCERGREHGRVVHL